MILPLASIDPGSDNPRRTGPTTLVLGLIMKRYLPGRVELLVLASLAIICSVILANLEARDAGLSLLAFPLFIFAAVLGLWKSGRLRGVDE
jgi:hypothetical protein